MCGASSMPAMMPRARARHSPGSVTVRRGPAAPGPVVTKYRSRRQTLATSGAYLPPRHRRVPGPVVGIVARQRPRGDPQDAPPRARVPPRAPAATTPGEATAPRGLATEQEHTMPSKTILGLTAAGLLTLAAAPA